MVLNLDLEDGGGSADFEHVFFLPLRPLALEGGGLHFVDAVSDGGVGSLSKWGITTAKGVGVRVKRAC